MQDQPPIPVIIWGASLIVQGITMLAVCYVALTAAKLEIKFLDRLSKYMTKEECRRIHSAHNSGCELAEEA